jgi:hypothetical protein
MEKTVFKNLLKAVFGIDAPQDVRTPFVSLVQHAIQMPPGGQ